MLSYIIPAKEVLTKSSFSAKCEPAGFLRHSHLQNDLFQLSSTNSPGDGSSSNFGRRAYFKQSRIQSLLTMPLLGLISSKFVSISFALNSGVIYTRKSARVLSFSEMKIVGNFVTETDVAMELCEKVQVEEYVIHVEESTNFYTHLRFSLLASTWFPRPLGVCLWSAMHMLLVLYEALMLLVLFPTGFVLAVLADAIMVASFIYMVLLIPCMVIGTFLGIIIAVVLAWLWLVITCQCCTLPGRAPGQGLGRYIFTAGGTLGPQNPQPAPGVEREAVAADRPFAFFNMGSFTLRFVRHVMLVSFPYRRAQLGDLCREIVPWYHTIVI